LYHGPSIYPVHVCPFVYPRGWGLPRWVIGAVLPPVFLASLTITVTENVLGLPPPQPAFNGWRYGPDLLLVNSNTGEVVDVVYGAFTKAYNNAAGQPRTKGSVLPFRSP